MNRLFLAAQVLTASLFLYSCNSLFPESEEHLQDTIQTIYASGEERPGTRNAIDNENFEISWTAGDAINVFFGTASSSRFVTEESGAVAKFKGSIDVITGGGEGLDDDTSLWGVYPYDSLNTCEGASVTLSLPAVQQSAENTFAPGIWPTVARSKNFYMSFYNVCGAFRFTVYHDNIKKVTLSGNNNEELAGKAKVSFVTEPLVEEISFGEKTITMSAPDGECFKPGVNYYLVVYPTAFSNGMTLTFYTEDSYASYVYSKSYTLNRSSSIRFNEWDKDLTFMALPSVDEKVYTDLSAEGTANCYLVSQAGDYKFKAVKGNTETTVGDVNAAEVLWESFGTNVMPNVGDLVSAVSFKDGYVQFSTPETFANGNAVIAVKDANGDILWSWHIWCSEEGWQEQVYLNNAGTMMDRNLGATSATPGDVGALGLLYQWGRKDPFLGSSSISSSVQALSTGTWSTSSEQISNDLATLTPTVFYMGSDLLPDGNWSSTVYSDKTVYDPCPVGWRIPEGGDDGIWKTAGFAKTMFDITNYGIAFDIADGGKTWYPASGYIKWTDGVLSVTGDVGRYWAFTNSSTTYKKAYLNFSDDYVYHNVTNEFDFGYPVRCLKDITKVVRPWDSYTDLSTDGTANCYLISQAGDYKFKAVKGNSTITVGNVSTVEVLWESFGTDLQPKFGDLITTVLFNDGYVHFSTPDTFANGNAVIAAKDSEGNILWSWHIWCSEEGWQEQVYLNNAGTMMDRNLGATSATPGDVGALGLLYQWGRKDPFLGSSSISSNVQALSTGSWSISDDKISNEIATKNPMVFYQGGGGSYYLPDGNWSSNKAVYDPCPVGWRVPDGGSNGVWATAFGTRVWTTASNWDSNNRGMDFSTTDYKLGNSGPIWYPAAGIMYDDRGWLIDSGTYGCYWSVTPGVNSNGAYCLPLDDNGKVDPSFDNKRAYGYSVRCLKEEDDIALQASVSAAASNIQLNSATISGSLSIQSDGSKSAVLYYSSSESTLEGLKSNGTSKTLTLEEDGSYSAALSSLYSSTSYNYVVVAKVDDVEFVSSIGNFLTSALPSEPLVDLGLSVKWASCNLGASKPTEYGGYYQWAGTRDVSDTSINLYWDNCPYHTGSDEFEGWTKYNYNSSYGTVDNKIVLESMDDAASVALGGSWRIPKGWEWNQLLNTDNCSWTWTTIDGVNGYKVQSKKSGYTDNWIFLPAAGYRYKVGLYGVGSCSDYWSSSLDMDVSYYACNMYFDSSSVDWIYTHRHYGQSVRPVSE